MCVPIFSGKGGILGRSLGKRSRDSPGEVVFLSLPMVTNTQDRVYIFFPDGGRGGGGGGSGDRGNGNRYPLILWECGRDLSFKLFEPF